MPADRRNSRDILRRLLEVEGLVDEDRRQVLELLALPEPDEVDWRLLRLFEKMVVRGTLEHASGRNSQEVGFRNPGNGRVWYLPIPGGHHDERADDGRPSFEPEDGLFRTLLSAMATNQSKEEITKALGPVEAEIRGRSRATSVQVLLWDGASLEPVLGDATGPLPTYTASTLQRVLEEGRPVGLQIPPSTILLPVRSAERTLGILEVQGVEGQAFTPSELDVFRLSAVAVAELLERAAKLETQIFVDRLTGLKNRAYFDDQILREVARIHRMNEGREGNRRESIALLMMDLDNFGSINNKWGHPVGDAALAGVGSVIRNQVRNVDVACRYGGEEFAIILPPPMSRSNALEAANRLLQKIRDEPYAATDSRLEEVRITVSVGVALFPDDVDLREHPRAIEILLDYADKALLQAKERGKDQVVAWGSF